MTNLPLHDDWQREIDAADERISDNHVCTVGELVTQATRGIGNILFAALIIVVAYDAHLQIASTVLAIR